MSRLRTPLFVLLLVVPAPAPAQSPRTTDPALPEGAMARIGTLRFWHRGAVRSLAFLPDGRTLASLGANNDFHLWDFASGAEKHQLEKQVTLRRPDPNFGMVVVGGPGGQMVLQAGGQQTAMFSPDGKLLAAGDSSGIRVWDTASGQPLRRFPIKESGIFSIAFSADSKHLAVAAGEPALVHVWEVGGKEVWQLRSPGNRWPVQQLAFAPNGAYLIAASAHELRVWDLARGKRVRVYQGHENTVTALAISPDSKRVASASEDNTVRLWEDSSEEEVAKLATPQGAVKALTFAPDGKTLATAGADLSLGLWDGASLKQVKDLGGPGVAGTALAFALDGKTLAVGGADGIIRLWDVAKGAQRIVARDAVPLLSVAYVERGSRIALGGAKGTVRYCDPVTGNVVRRFGPPEGKGVAVEFATGCRVAAVMSKEEVVVLHDLIKGKELFRLKAEDAPTFLVLSPDGRLLAGTFGEAKQARLLDAATGKTLRSFGEPGSTSLIAFTPDGRALATIGDESLIHLWEVTTGKERWRFRGPPGTMRCVAFAPGGRLLATGGEDETVRVWDVLTGKMKRGLVGPGGAVTAVVFSPDGKRLASGNEDGTVRVWEVASGEEQRHFEGHRGRVVALDFSPDGRRLVSGSDDTTAILWDLERPARVVRPVDREPRLEKLWADLESDDASVAFAAHAALTEVPREAVLFLRHRLRPVSPADPSLVVRLIADLGHRRFAARERAMRELERLEGQAEQPLRRVLEAKPSVEVQKRLKILLGRLEAGPSSGPELRAVRAVELLEQLNTGESRLLLEELSRGAAGARLTEEARAALRRLARRANADSE